MNFKLISGLLTTTLLTSCVSVQQIQQIQQAQTWNGIVKFSPAPSEVFTSQNLKDFLLKNKSPKIVLRASDSYSDFSIARQEKTSYQSLYNDIEKELLKAGFTVRDRKLFERVVQSGNVEISDGKQVKKQFDTDLILELVNISSVNFVTNKFTSVKGDEKVLSKGEIKMNGARAEFKLILLNENEISGAYKFNYAPCIDGCNYTIDYFGNLYSQKNKTNIVESYEVMKSDINPFIIRCMQDLINEIKK